MADRNLILLRGVSGAGKSTVANLFVDAHIISTDDFFIFDGEYRFDANNLAKNHAKAVDMTEQEMRYAMYHYETEKHTIVIHNTFTKRWEMKPYFILAEKYGYMIHTLIVENRHESESIHNIPQPTVEAQRYRFEVIL